MINRHYITEGLYSTFSQQIVLNDFDDFPVFLHEVYHHIQNNTTILGAERLNLVVQFWAHLSTLTQNSETLSFPLSTLLENETSMAALTEVESNAVRNLIDHLDGWLYLEKSNYEPHKVPRDTDVGTIKEVEEPEMGSFSPYIVKADGRRKRAYPVGGHTISESGAYALQLYHTPNADASILENINDSNYQYLVILDHLYGILKNFRVACLATFLFCDLAMLISSPSIGFYALFNLLPLTLKEGMDENDMLAWYELQFESWQNEIVENMQAELAMVSQIQRDKTHLSLAEPINETLDALIDLIYRGLKLRMSDPFVFINRLLSGKNEDVAELLKEYPISLIEDKSTNEQRYGSEDGLQLFVMMETTSTFLLGFLMDFNHVLKHKDIQHLEKFGDNEYRFVIQTDEQKQSDAFGYIVHLLGLENIPIKHLVLTP